MTHFVWNTQGQVQIPWEYMANPIILFSLQFRTGDTSEVSFIEIVNFIQTKCKLYSINTLNLHSKIEESQRLLRLNKRLIYFPILLDCSVCSMCALWVH